MTEKERDDLIANILNNYFYDNICAKVSLVKDESDCPTNCSSCPFLVTDSSKAIKLLVASTGVDINKKKIYLNKIINIIVNKADSEAYRNRINDSCSFYINYEMYTEIRDYLYKRPIQEISEKLIKLSCQKSN